VTEGDFLRRGELGTMRKRSTWLDFIIGSGWQADDYVQANGRVVEEVMSPRPIVIAPDAEIADLVELMTTHKIKRVPVLDEGMLVGIVARADVMRAFLRVLPATAPAAIDDERIRAMIVDELARQPWSGTIRVKVTHGVAELAGAIFDERARAASRVAAENVAGVVKVVDHLTWIEPMSGMCILPEEPRS
jgi:CBS domain-containing protein